VGQPAFGVWYLAQQEQEGPPVTRNCTIPFGRTLLIPIVSIAICAAPTDTPEQHQVEFLRGRTRDFIADSTNFSLTIDGTSVPNVQNYYEESTPFKLSDRINGIPGDPCVDSGYYVAVSNLLPGNHTIHWHADSITLDNRDVTYNIKVGFLPF
jgi:hypothetical protein